MSLIEDFVKDFEKYMDVLDSNCVIVKHELYDKWFVFIVNDDGTVREGDEVMVSELISDGDILFIDNNCVKNIKKDNIKKLFEIIPSKSDEELDMKCVASTKTISELWKMVSSKIKDIKRLYVMVDKDSKNATYQYG